ncbi:MAG: Crp/Fnr family transcriptional regulator [Actinomycetota bacterium]|nr:Crp/Fnr family transcriptional regulator [Actinomycetota bacterium]
MALTTDVLGEDRELARPLDEGRRALARREGIAAVLELPSGTWDAREAADNARGGFGLLILAGLLVRRVGRDGRFGAELLCAGDIVRPWEHDGEETTVPFDTTWRVLAPTRLAVLDLAWARRMGPFPEVGGALIGRAMERSRRLAVNMAIAQHPRLEMRLEVLLWHLAERLGRVRTDGVHLTLPVTHETLANLVAARRPSVSAALGALAERGVVRRDGEGWVLLGDPPADLDAA